MTSDFKIIEEPKKTLSMHPQKFALWLFMITVVMVFAALTSAYIVRQAEGNWLVFELPQTFWYSTALIAVSSITMHWAYLAAKKDNLDMVKVAIIITTILGLLFTAAQYHGWKVLAEEGYHFVGNNVSVSFLIVLVGLHVVHLVSGMIVLLVSLVSTFKYKVHSKNLNRLQMCMTYWHFLGGLWIYLFIFLLLNHN
ncbi:cytochrome c oxidase subunit 3 [Fulvivirga sediminis]|uniref:Cytochrome c oxidase subunit 3 n=1 Tax=Fulvivirga sediminis TaxID=2803949 RepID=A0A937F5P6_9BACT|nr:cytochrome c oxidase subunit 3 [Fulvivirga sediminis]MBL3655432.1 cytochrome c oxidase subunit 3 [Fulvivirga sediminis]